MNPDRAASGFERRGDTVPTLRGAAGGVERPSMPTPEIWFHTLRHLRPRQLLGQVALRVQPLWERPERFGRRPAPSRPPLRWRPRGEFLPPGPQDNTESALLDGRLRFLNETREVGWPPRWDLPEAPRLWHYNLHYGDFLWALSYEEARLLALDWIEHHPLARGAVGWEPYPVSLRVVNWCAYFHGRHAAATGSDVGFSEALWASIHRQCEWLARHLETHIRANHLLENAIALALCGSAFSGEAGERWKRIGLALLRSELEEQVPPDGCHYEASPMYHLRVLYGLIALHNTGDADLAACVEAPRDRMASALTCLCHPDRQIALLADSAHGVYNTPDQLRDACGATTRAALEPPSEPHSWALPDSGYYGAQHPDGHYVICDAGAIRPDYQPGHAHADLFSFELRRHCRSTAAHNTIEIDGCDQSELWSVFRVGRRAAPRDVRFDESHDGFRLRGWHDGYARLKGRPRHHRRFEWHERGALCAVDRIESRVDVSIASRLHLHPDCEISAADDRVASVAFPGGRFHVAFVGPGRLSIEPSRYCPRFGVEIANRALVFRTTGRDVELGFSLSIESRDDARSLSDSLLSA
jgi:uncharacterized heparinase superfamily protein